MPGVVALVGLPVGRSQVVAVAPAEICLAWQAYDHLVAILPGPARKFFVRSQRVYTVQLTMPVHVPEGVD